MTPSKIEAGASFPDIRLPGLTGDLVDLSAPLNGCDWKLVVIYRGRHCPMCTKYLNALEHQIAPLRAIGVDTVAASADSQDQLLEHKTRLAVNFPLCHGLSIDHMRALGVYISSPRSAKETDHPFSEPGLFVVNAEGRVQVVDISNNPFARPDLQTLVNGLTWIRDPENDYPIRGTYR